MAHRQRPDRRGVRGAGCGRPRLLPLPATALRPRGHRLDHARRVAAPPVRELPAALPAGQPPPADLPVRDGATRRAPPRPAAAPRAVDGAGLALARHHGVAVRHAPRRHRPDLPAGPGLDGRAAGASRGGHRPRSAPGPAVGLLRRLRRRPRRVPPDLRRGRGPRLPPVGHPVAAARRPDARARLGRPGGRPRSDPGAVRPVGPARLAGLRPRDDPRARHRPHRRALVARRPGRDLPRAAPRAARASPHPGHGRHRRRHPRPHGHRHLRLRPVDGGAARPAQGHPGQLRRRGREQPHRRPQAGARGGAAQAADRARRRQHRRGHPGRREGPRLRRRRRAQQRPRLGEPVRLDLLRPRLPGSVGDGGLRPALDRAGGEEQPTRPAPGQPAAARRLQHDQRHPVRLRLGARGPDRCHTRPRPAGARRGLSRRRAP